MEVNIIKPYKSIMETKRFNLPSFTVLCGENGSGKTHLFEILSNNRYSSIHINDMKLKNIKFIPFNGLNPDIDIKCDSSRIDKRTNELWNLVDNAKKKTIDNSKRVNKEVDFNDGTFEMFISQDKNLDILKRISKESEVDLANLTQNIIGDHIKAEDISKGDIFSSKFALLFKNYHIHFIDNKLNKVYREEGIENHSRYLNNEEFIERYGEPPWDFVNEILSKLSLPYEANNPMNDRRESPFNFKLKHKTLNVEIDVDDLSTGEKTLLSLALAIYSCTYNQVKVDLLILDEPDASLHPSMSKIMLEILEQDIVYNFKIPVIISTHTPSTVALAKSHCVYKMDKECRIPVSCDHEDAVKYLSYGIPNLKVSIDDRRQVFVESNYDVSFYEKIFNILSKTHDFRTKPLFLPPHSSIGSNCTDVINIVNKLSEMGNDLVYGLIDYDNKNKELKNIIVLGESNRYAIENYIFDPLLVGLYMIKKNFVSCSDMNLVEVRSYADICMKLNLELVISIVKYVEKSLNLEGSECLESTLINGFTVQINKQLAVMKGHELEQLYKNVWPKLNFLNGKGDGALKLDIIINIFEDFHNYISEDILKTFHKIV